MSDLIDIMAPVDSYFHVISDAYRKAAAGWKSLPTPIAEAVGRFYAALEGGQVSAPASQGGGVKTLPAGAKPMPGQALKGWAQGRYLNSARMGLA